MRNLTRCTLYDRKNRTNSYDFLQIKGVHTLLQSVSLKPIFLFYLCNWYDICVAVFIAIVVRLIFYYLHTVRSQKSNQFIRFLTNYTITCLGVFLLFRAYSCWFCYFIWYASLVGSFDFRHRRLSTKFLLLFLPLWRETKQEVKVNETKSKRKINGDTSRGLFSSFSLIFRLLQLKKGKQKKKRKKMRRVNRCGIPGVGFELNATHHASSIAVSLTTKAILEATLLHLSFFLNPIPVTVSI